MAERGKSRSAKKDPKQVLDDIHKVLDELPDAYAYAFHPGRLLFFNYLKGIMSGLGVVTAFAIIIPLAIWILQSIHWGPILDQFIGTIIERVEEARR